MLKELLNDQVKETFNSVVLIVIGLDNQGSVLWFLLRTGIFLVSKMPMPTVGPS